MDFENLAVAMGELDEDTVKVCSGRQSLLLKRDRCRANRYFPDPLGVVTAPIIYRRRI